MPQITVASSPISSSTAASSSSFSASLRVGDSPVVPATTSAVGAVLDQVARQPPRGVHVDAPVRVERRGHRRDHAADLAIGSSSGTGTAAQPAKHRRAPVRPGPRLLELGGDPDQQVLAAERRRRAGRRSAGRPRSSAAGSEIAGWPVTLKGAGEGRRSCAPGEAPPAGRGRSRRRCPSGGGSSPSVGVSRRSIPPSYQAGDHPRRSPGAGRPPPGTRPRAEARPSSASAQVERLDVLGGDLAPPITAELVEGRGLPGAPAGRKVSTRSIAVEPVARLGSSTSCPSDSSSSRRLAGRGARRRIGLDASASGSVSSADPQRARVGAELIRVGARRRRARRMGRRGPGPWTASRIAAVSRTDRETTSSTVSPTCCRRSAAPREVRWRVGFRPTSPHCAGRDPDRAAAVVGVGHRDHARRRPRPPSRRSSRPSSGRCPRGCGVGAVGLGLGGRQDPQLGRVGLADRDEARVAEALREVGVERGAEVRAP